MLLLYTPANCFPCPDDLRRRDGEARESPRAGYGVGEDSFLCCGEDADDDDDAAPPAADDAGLCCLGLTAALTAAMAAGEG